MDESGGLETEERGQSCESKEKRAVFRGRAVFYRTSMSRVQIIKDIGHHAKSWTCVRKHF